MQVDQAHNGGYKIIASRCLAQYSFIKLSSSSSGIRCVFRNCPVTDSRLLYCRIFSLWMKHSSCSFIFFYFMDRQFSLANFDLTNNFILFLYWNALNYFVLISIFWSIILLKYKFWIVKLRGAINIVAKWLNGLAESKIACSWKCHFMIVNYIVSRLCTSCKKLENSRRERRALLCGRKLGSHNNYWRTRNYILCRRGTQQRNMQLLCRSDINNVFPVLRQRYHRGTEHDFLN